MALELYLNKAVTTKINKIIKRRASEGRRRTDIMHRKPREWILHSTLFGERDHLLCITVEWLSKTMHSVFCHSIHT